MTQFVETELLQCNGTTCRLYCRAAMAIWVIGRRSRRATAWQNCCKVRDVGPWLQPKSYSWPDSCLAFILSRRLPKFVLTFESFFGYLVSCHIVALLQIFVFSTRCSVGNAGDVSPGLYESQLDNDDSIARIQYLKQSEQFRYGCIGIGIPIIEIASYSFNCNYISICPF